MFLLSTLLPYYGGDSVFKTTSIEIRVLLLWKEEIDSISILMVGEGDTLLLLTEMLATFLLL